MAEKRRTRKAQEVAEKPVEDLDKEILAEEKEAPEKASPAPKTGIVLPSLLNMRTGAGKEFPPIQRLKAGQTVEIVETVGKWYKVKVDEGEGFVMSAYIEVK